VEINKDRKSSRFMIGLFVIVGSLIGFVFIVWLGASKYLDAPIQTMNTTPIRVPMATNRPIINLEVFLFCLNSTFFSLRVSIKEVMYSCIGRTFLKLPRVALCYYSFLFLIKHNNTVSYAENQIKIVRYDNHRGSEILID
jgi:hypothetical protein